MSPEDLVNWLAVNPEVSIITDMKDGNTYLPLLREVIGSMQHRFIVQIYDPGEFDAAKNLGFERQIFTAYNMPDDNWHAAVNALNLFAVTIPASRMYLADGVRHPVFLHTVNRPLKADGLYTDCLIPG